MFTVKFFQGDGRPSFFADDRPLSYVSAHVAEVLRVS